MTVPLVILALITCVAGFIPFGDFVSADGKVLQIHTTWPIALASIGIAVVGIGIAAFKFFKEHEKPAVNEASMTAFARAAYHRFYIDEVYMFITKRIIFNGVSKGIAWFDRHVVDGFMNFLAWGANRVSYDIRGLQSGQVQQYAYVFVLGALLLVIIAILI